jgi:hypothetical protein
VEELFVLEGPRSLLRLSTAPDPFCTADQMMANPLGTDETEGVGLESVGANIVSSVSSTVTSRNE